MADKKNRNPLNLTPKEAYDKTMKLLSSPPLGMTKKINKIFAGTNKKTVPPTPGNVAERFDKALEGIPFTAKQRTSMYNAANKIYKNFLKDSEKGISRIEKKIKEGTIEPSVKVKKIKKSNIIPRTRARIASLKVQDPEVGQEGPYKDTTDFFANEGKAIGDAAQYEKRMAKKDVKRNMGGRVRGVGQAIRGFGKAKYSDKMY